MAVTPSDEAVDLMATLETIQPYVEQLFDDSDVQKHLSRAAANLRGARSRASDAKSKKKALQDRRLRQRLLAGGRAAVAAGVAVKEGPEKRARRNRRRWLLVARRRGSRRRSWRPTRRRARAWPA